MKGYWIEIVNNLLDPKHRKAMKESVWLFMWLLDKITSISEEQVGMVSGGKPIAYEEVNRDLDLPERTYRDWVSRLKKHQYIKTKRAPNGLIFFVNKAKKRFGQKIRDRQKSAYGKKDVDNPVENHMDNLGTEKRDVQKTQVGYAEKVGSDVQKTPDPYMYNNTIDNTIQDNIIGDNKNKENLNKFFVMHLNLYHFQIFLNFLILYMQQKDFDYLFLLPIFLLQI